MADVDRAYVARFRRRFGGDDATRRYVEALYEVLSNTLGADKMVLRAGKLEALKLMRSASLPDRHSPMVAIRYSSGVRNANCT